MATDAMERAHESAYQDVARDALARSSPSASPRAILLGGQPGSGKSVLAAQAAQELRAQGGVVVIDADRMRERHPDYKRLSIEDPANAADRTHKEAGQWAQRLTGEAISGKRNLLVDGTMRNPDAVRDLSERLQASGYRIEARVMAVSPEVSLTRAQLRFEQQIEARGYGRNVNSAQHDAAFKGLSKTIVLLERDSLVDSVRVYASNHAVIYQNSGGREGWDRPSSAGAVLEAERSRPQSTFERRDYIEALQELSALVRQRTGEPARDVEARLDQARIDFDRQARSPTHLRAEAFDRMSGVDALAIHPELDAAFKRLQQVKQGWTPQTSQDQRERSYFDARATLSNQLHAGVIPAGNVTPDESRRVIEIAANYRGLMVRDAQSLRLDFKGEVVAVSSHHALLRVSDMVAVRYDKASLDRGLEAGDKVGIQYGTEKSLVDDARRLPVSERAMGHEREYR